MSRLVSCWPLLALAGAVACGRAAKTAPAAAPADELDRALEPARFAAAVRKLGGAHFHGSAFWRINPKQAAAPGVVSSAPENGITTITDLWIDATGQYRLVETNDQDGGREVVLYDHDLSVGLRYGKMIRRPAQEPEPTRILQQALGAPFAAWEIVRRMALVSRPATGEGQPTYRLHAGAPARAGTKGRPGSASAEVTALRKWRETVKVESLGGEVRLDDRLGLPLTSSFKARFSLVRDGEPCDGELAVTTIVNEIGTTAAIAPPTSEELRPRQRTVLEERALLEGMAKR